MYNLETNKRTIRLLEIQLVIRIKAGIVYVLLRWNVKLKPKQIQNNNVVLRKGSWTATAKNVISLILLAQIICYSLQNKDFFE